VDDLADRDNYYYWKLAILQNSMVNATDRPINHLMVDLFSNYCAAIVITARRRSILEYNEAHSSDFVISENLFQIA
jgi:hypothetical protein